MAVRAIKIWCLVAGLLFVTSCATNKVHTTPESERFAFASPPPPSTMRFYASDGTELNWVNHPCTDAKGVPFKKYKQFAIDAQGKVYGRKSADDGTGVEISQKSKAGTAWTDVTAFFDEQGISKACNGGTKGDQAKKTEEAPKKKKVTTDDDDDDDDDDDQDVVDTYQGKFVPPINNPSQFYYDSLRTYQATWATRTISEFDQLSVLVSSSHIQQKDQPDILVKNCDEVRDKLKPEQTCISQVRHNYTQARQKMMGDLDLREVRPGVYEAYDYYCQMWMGEEQFRQAGVNTEFPGPGKITHNRVMNCEHTWPQSKFPAPKKSAENLGQKTDLHHIFSTNSKINGIRANYEFGEVDKNSPKAKTGSCLDKKGEGVLAPVLPVDGVTEATHLPFFEPPAAHKGNVARALFYFATRYRVKMSETQEFYLRKWNKMDPPDDMEIKRNERIYELSGVRNPYIDHPEFVDQIPSFSK